MLGRDPEAAEVAAFISTLSPLHTIARTERLIPMNPNQALWEKGDFTRLAESMRASGEELGRPARHHRRARGARSRLWRRDDCVPAARLGADVLGVDIARNLVEAGNLRAKEEGLTNLRFQEGDACDLADLDDGRSISP